MILVVSKRNPDCKNIKITKKELNQIRQLSDFDLTMFMSDLDDFGWDRRMPDGNAYGAKHLLPLIEEALKARTE